MQAGLRDEVNRPAEELSRSACRAEIWMSTQLNDCIYQCSHTPKCRHDHRLKQDPRWKVEQITPATFRWTAPSGRSSTTEPTRYPI